MAGEVRFLGTGGTSQIKETIGGRFDEIAVAKFPSHAAGIWATP